MMAAWIESRKPADPRPPPPPDTPPPDGGGQQVNRHEVTEDYKGNIVRILLIMKPHVIFGNMTTSACSVHV